MIMSIPEILLNLKVLKHTKTLSESDIRYQYHRLPIFSGFDVITDFYELIIPQYGYKVKNFSALNKETFIRNGQTGLLKLHLGVVAA